MHRNLDGYDTGSVKTECCGRSRKEYVPPGWVGREQKEERWVVRRLGGRCSPTLNEKQDGKL